MLNTGFHVNQTMRRIFGGGRLLSWRIWDSQTLNVVFHVGRTPHRLKGLVEPNPCGSCAEFDYVEYWYRVT